MDIHPTGYVVHVGLGVYQPIPKSPQKMTLHIQNTVNPPISPWGLMFDAFWVGLIRGEGLFGEGLILGGNSRIYGTEKV